MSLEGRGSSQGITGSNSNTPLTFPLNRAQEPSAEDEATSQNSLSVGGRKRGIGPAEAIKRGLEFGPLQKSMGRHNSTTGILESRSPSSRFSRRALSASDKIGNNVQKGRLQKDYNPKDADEEGAIKDSEDDVRPWSSADEDSPSGQPRGRTREKREPGGDGLTPTSPLATEAETQPEVTLTPPPEGGQPSAKRFVIHKVHPNTNYDQTVSRGLSPTTSESEEQNDIRRAQKLNVNCSAIDSSVPNRVIQTFIRGDFAQMHREAEEGLRRLRTYLVATDLSNEAAYALEWTIGTILRDGDTLLAVYAVDEEIGTGKTSDSLPIGEGGKAMQETTAVMDQMTATASQKGSLMSLSKAARLPGSRKSSAARSTDSRAKTKAQHERLHAIETLSETCLRFLRKTKLQVRLAIEVIHCKSPKHMVTEAVSPLLVSLYLQE